MKKLLIIRSASFQQLDKNLSSIRAAFPEHELHLLTHEHGRKLAEKYAEVRKVLIYPHDGPFAKGKDVPGLADENYDDVAVLVANLTGAGFANVFEFAFGLGAGRVHRVNLIGESREITPPDAAALRRSHRLCRAAAATAGTLLGLCAALVLLLSIPLSKLLPSKEAP